MAIETLDQMWGSYAATVLPKDAPMIQIVETESAFKSGAARLLQMMTDDVAALPEEEGMAVLSAWR